MRKRILIYASALVVASGSVVFGASAMASAASKPATAHYDKLAKETRHHDHKIRLHARLNQAVRDGSITAAQKKALASELKSLAAERKNDLSKTSSKAQRQAERTRLSNELKTWAQNNSLPLAKIFPKLANFS